MSRHKGPPLARFAVANTKAEGTKDSTSGALPATCASVPSASVPFLPDVQVDPVLAGLHVVVGLMLAAKREPGRWKCMPAPAECTEAALRLASGFASCRVNVTPHQTTRDLAVFSVRYDEEA